MTDYTKRPVIQPSEDAITFKEKMALIKQANDDLEIRHHFPGPDEA